MTKRCCFCSWLQRLSWRHALIVIQALPKSLRVWTPKKLLWCIEEWVKILNSLDLWFQNCSRQDINSRPRFWDDSAFLSPRNLRMGCPVLSPMIGFCKKIKLVCSCHNSQAPRLDVLIASHVVACRTTLQPTMYTIHTHTLPLWILRISHSMWLADPVLIVLHYDYRSDQSWGGD